MTVLAQTYLHLAVDPSRRQISETLLYLEYLAALSARDHFRQDVELEFRIEEGSLKGWLTVIGTLGLQLLSNYGSLREGIDFAVKDSREFSEWIIQKIKAEVEMPPSALYRTERRLGLAGRIQRLYPLLEATSVLLEGRSSAEALRQLHQVQEQLERIRTELREAGELEILDKVEVAVPASISGRLPMPSPSPAQPQAPQVILNRDETYTRRGRPDHVLLQFREPPTPPVFR